MDKKALALQAVNVRLADHGWLFDYKQRVSWQHWVMFSS
jgi:hypothetical protein